MGLFGKNKNRLKTDYEKENEVNTNGYSGHIIKSIKVLGMGCTTCHAQLKNVKNAVKSLELDTDVEYITDLKEIAQYGVMSVPAIVLNERVVAGGKIYSEKEVIEMLNQKGGIQK